MARPSPTEYFSHDDEGFTEYIVSAPGVWWLTYNGAPINIRRNSTAGPVKYLRTMFGHQAHAVRLARRLNERYATEGFDVMSLSSKRNTCA